MHHDKAAPLTQALTSARCSSLWDERGGVFLKRPVSSSFFLKVLDSSAGVAVQWQQQQQQQQQQQHLQSRKKRGGRPKQRADERLVLPAVQRLGW
jgi:hypothetical protein